MNSEIDRLKSSRNEADRERAIELLNSWLEENPQDVEAWFAKACCHDFLGQEEEAEPCYRHVYQLGLQNLAPENHYQFFVGFGSTLRNNLKFEESEKILEEAVRLFSEYPALKVFLALTQYSMKKDRPAARNLFSAVLESSKEGLDGYEGAVEWYVKNLDTHPIDRG